MCKQLKMGVSRNIIIQVYSDIDNTYELIKKFLIGSWLKEEGQTINMFYIDDTDNYVLPYDIAFNETQNIITERFKKRKVNTIPFSVNQLNERIILSVKEMKNEHRDDHCYEILISPRGAYTLKEFERNTDFSYYLNIILPRLQLIGCQVWEIKCLDFG